MVSRLCELVKARSTFLLSPCARRAGAVAPSVTLFYFFDFSAVNVHTLLGW